MQYIFFKILSIFDSVLIWNVSACYQLTHINVMHHTLTLVDLDFDYEGIGLQK